MGGQPETDSLEQKAVLYSFIGYDGNGDPKLDDPVEIPARYEESDRSTNRPKDSPVTKKTTVYVDRVIAIDSRIYLGPLDEVPDDLDVFSLRFVVDYEEIPDIKANYFQRTVTLS